MRTSTSAVINRSRNMRAIRIFTLLALVILTGLKGLSQPVWVAGTPVATGTYPTTINSRYGIDRIGTVYLVVYNYNNPGPYTSAQVKADAISGPSGSRIFTNTLAVNAGQVGLSILQILSGLQGSTNYTYFWVAQDQFGTLQVSPVKYVATTKPCPSINLAFAWSTPDECVNKGSSLTLTFFPGDATHNPDLDGLYIGTQFFINWGDGSTLSWPMSAAERASVSFSRTHTYTTTTACNYEPFTTVTSICNPLIVKPNASQVVVHGLDNEGGGSLLIVDNATGSTTIQVCEGVSHSIAIKDMSTWNCQAPKWLDGSDAPANTDPRTIQWLYGIDDGGILQNTIGLVSSTTPQVYIGGMVNYAQRTVQGYAQPVITPAPYQGSVSQSILIPATCRAGEYFNVYLRNWNKCNPYPSDPPLWTQIQILVVAAPSAPTISNVSVCNTGSQKLAVTSAVIGRLKWYNADKSSVVFTGAIGAQSYTPSNSIPSTTTYNVAEIQTGGNVCEGPSSPVTLRVYSLPVVTFGGTLTAQCVSSTTYVLTGGSPAGGTYSGTGVSGTNFNASIAGTGTKTITYSYTDVNGCTNTANNTIVVNSLPLTTAANNGPVCAGKTLSLTGGPGGMTTYAWTGPNSFSSSSQSPTVSVSATAAMAGTYTLTTTNSNGCINTATTTVTVYALPLTTAANNGPVCAGKTLSLTGGPGGMTTYAWTGPNSFSSSSQSPTVSVSATAAMAGTYTLTTTNSNGCINTATTTVTVYALPLTTAANNGPVCAGKTLSLTGGPGGMTTYAWTGPNSFSSSSQSPTVSVSATAAMAGTYTLTTTNSNGCINTATTTVTVYALPLTTAANNGPVCAGKTLSLTGGPGGMTTYAWTGPNSFSSSSQSPTVSVSATAAMAGTYTLTTTNSNGCINTATTTVTVYALPVATAANNGPVCAGKTLSLTGGPGGMTTYAWTGPNSFSSSSQSPTVSVSATAAMAGTYTLTTTNSNGCINTATTTVSVNPLPIPSLNGPASVCLNSVGNVYTTEAGMTNYTWVVSAGGTITAGGGATNNTVTVKWTTAGTSTVSINYTNENACTATSPTVFTVAVGTSPTLATLTGSGDACYGSISTLNSVITGGAPPYIINYTANTIAQTAIGSYASGTDYSLNSGTPLPVNTYDYRITSVEDACGSFVPGGGLPAVPYTIHINPIPDASSTVNAAATICKGGTTDIVLGSDVAGTTFDWTVDDPSSAGAIAGVNQAIGYNIAQTLTNSTTGVVSVTYHITPKGPATTNCIGTTVDRVVQIEPTPKAAMTNMAQTLCNGGTLAGIVISNAATHVGSPTFDLAIVATTGLLTDLTATGNAKTTLTGNSYPYTISGTLTNNTSSAITIEYRATPKLGACAVGTDVIAVVKIEPTPKASMTNTAQTLCNGGALTGIVISNAATHVGSPTFDLAIVATTGLLTDLTATGNAKTTLTGNSYPYTISGTLTNNTSSAITIEYRATPKLGACAVGTDVIAVVKIEPTPKASMTNTAQTLCNGGALTGIVISNAATHVGSPTFDLAIVATTGLLTDLTATGNAKTTLTGNSYPYTISGTLTNNTSSAITIEYRATPKLGACAVGTDVIAVVKIEPTPKASMTNTAQTLCNGGALTGIVISNAATHVGSPTFDLAIVATTGLLTDLTATGNAKTTLTGNSYPYTISGTLTNNTSSAITIEYRATPKLGACAVGTDVIAVVKIEPTPKASMTNTAQTLCNGGALTGIVISNAATHVGSPTFDLAIVATTGLLTDLTATGNAKTTLTGNSYPYTISGTLTNNTSSAITIEYRATPKLGACAVGTDVIAVVKIEPTPKASMTNTAQTLCNGGALTGIVISNAATHVGSPTFDLAIVATTGLLTDLTATGNAKTTLTGNSYPYTISGTLTNNTSSAITIEYRATPKLGACAVGTDVIAVVKIEPTPKASMTNTAQTLCNGGALTGIVISNAATHVGSPTFDLAIVATTGLLTDLTATGNAKTTLTGNSYPYTISGTLTNNTSSAITIEYRATPKLGACAVGTDVIAVVKIEPTPKASMTNTAQTLCNGGALTGIVISNAATHVGSPTFDLAIVATTGLLTDLTATGNAKTTLTGNSYPYTISGTLTNNTSSAITIEYRATPKLGACAVGTDVIAVVKIEPTPKASMTNTAQTLCNGGALTGIVISNAATHVGSPTFDLAIVATTGLLTDLTATGNAKTTLTGNSYPYTISGTLTNNTSSAITIEYRATPKLGACAVGTDVIAVVKIEPTPKASMTNTAQTLCNGGALTGIVISNAATHVGSPTFDLAIVATTGLLTDLTATGNAKTTLTGNSYPYTISGTLTNNTSSAITIEYRATPKLGACAVGTDVIAVVKIEPTPKAAITNLFPDICTGGATSVTINTPNVSTIPANLSFDLDVVSSDNAATGDMSVYNGTSLAYPYNFSNSIPNTTNDDVTVTFTATPKLSGCASGSAEVTTIVIEPTPKAAITHNGVSPVCDGENVDIDITTVSASSGANPILFDLVVSSTDPGNTSGGAYTNLPNHTFPLHIGSDLKNNSNVPITVTFTVTPKIGTCSGTAQHVDIIVNPSPELTSATGVVCSGNAATAAPVCNVTESTFDWVITTVTNVHGVSVGQPGSGDTFSELLYNDGTMGTDGVTPGTVIYTVTPKNKPIWGGCEGTPGTVTITVNPATHVKIAQDNYLIAAGDVANISGSITGGTVNGTWSVVSAPVEGTFGDPVFNNATKNSTTFDPTAFQDDAGFVKIRLTSADPDGAGPCGVVWYEANIHIGALPTADAGPDQKICEPAGAPQTITLIGRIGGSGTTGTWTAPAPLSGSLSAPVVTGPFDNGTPLDPKDDYYVVTQVYTINPSDLALPNNYKVLNFILTSNDPDGAGPVPPATDDVNITVLTGPHTPLIGGGGKEYYVRFLLWEFLLCSFACRQYLYLEYRCIDRGGCSGELIILLSEEEHGYNFIAIDWISEGTYNLKVLETTNSAFLGISCTGDWVTKPIAVYKEPVVSAGSDQTLCIGETGNLTGTVTVGSGSYHV